MALRKLKPIEERDPYAAAVLDAFDALESGESIRTKSYVQGVGWCWMEDGEVIEVVEDDA